jgi:hypothetical protein
MNRLLLPEKLMSERDLFVAVVALVLGVMMLYSAILNEGWCFQMAFARKISKHRGNESARYAIGSVGTLVIFLGMFTLIAPYLGSKSSRETAAEKSRGEGSAATALVTQ